MMWACEDRIIVSVYFVNILYFVVDTCITTASDLLEPALKLSYIWMCG